ncbi:flagellar basal-body rod protein FlgG [Bacillus sp. V-88]|uniref:flagellar hook-basal body protein n=1 Tax=Rossellomorea vietnamensis TaxID=218284 RepID=UPI000554E86A|nr:flagellar hook-basal body protein [Rossellomorea vietnamensis]OXS56453.1 flagellar biosynthesis protein FlgG [Bacillus sp. DSM 27956]PRX72867.1 flagellar basal-body rod protein FlgG [Bacillus sp. V-88]SLK24218.1 flagellar basal-body rod protein FlgG [Bacillus sp. V-88]
MNRTMITATNTLGQLQKQMDMIGHNLSNADTYGYKRRDATFSEMLVQQVKNQSVDKFETGRLTPLGVREGNGAKLSQAQLILNQGSLKATGRSLDFALTSDRQFFKVLSQDEDSSAVRYTRDGAFSASPTGNGEMMLVNGSGLPVLDENDNYITFSEDAAAFELGDNGVLTVRNSGGGEERFYLGVVTVEKSQFLQQYGGNLLGFADNLDQLGVTEDEVVTNVTGGARTDISMVQNSLEGSNVDISKEMTDMLSVQRSYQFQARSISLADQMMGLVNGIR